jgi:hypothetical protein
MSKKRWSFKFSDVKRAVQVAKDTGLPVAGYRIAPDGTITVDTLPKIAREAPSAQTANTWDNA